MPTGTFDIYAVDGCQVQVCQRTNQTDMFGLWKKFNSMMIMFNLDIDLKAQFWMHSVMSAFIWKTDSEVESTISLLFGLLFTLDFKRVYLLILVQDSHRASCTTLLFIIRKTILNIFAVFITTKKRK